MLPSVLKWLYRCLRIRSLAGKVVLLCAVPVLLSLLGSAVVVVEGGWLTRRYFLKQRMEPEADAVAQALSQRAEAVCDAARKVACDPDVVRETQVTEADLTVLRSRVGALQDGFALSLVHVLDQHGTARAGVADPSTSLDASSSSSLFNVSESGTPVARAVGDGILLLCRAPMNDGEGAVVVGTDLETELSQLRASKGLCIDMGLSLRGAEVGTAEGLPFGAGTGCSGDQCSIARTIRLGSTPAQLLLVRPGSGIIQITHVALLMTVGSTLAAALLPCAMSLLVVRAVASPLREMSGATSCVARGDLEPAMHAWPNPLALGDGDELGLLIRSFNRMLENLRALCTDLDEQIATRTAGLAIAADVARAVSSSAELDVLLRRSAQTIRESLADVCPGVYHVGIYLVEEGTDVVVLEQAAGEATDDFDGQRIRIPVGSKSPVGLAVATRRSQVLHDVRKTPAHVKPPLLMDTHSAVAVPMLVGDERIGALDVQSRQPDAFPSSTRQLLDVLADQTASAVFSARIRQRERRAAERLAELDQLKTQFLVMMSHRLRHPLRTITGLAGGLVEANSSTLAGQQKKQVSLIHALGQHLLELTDDFLDTSGVRHGAIALAFDDVDMHLLIESCLDAIAPLTEGRPITLRANVGVDLPIICADKRRIRQVLLNILSSAAAFTDAGCITVSARSISALDIDRGEMELFVEVRISDTGLAVSKKKLRDGLRTSVRPRPSQASDCVVAGFGLPMAKTLIDLHGGRIWVNGETGEGVTFTFILPVRQLNASSPEAPGHAPA